MIKIGNIFISELEIILIEEDVDVCDELEDEVGDLHHDGLDILQLPRSCYCEISSISSTS
jgi:hypothetical protein